MVLAFARIASLGLFYGQGNHRNARGDRKMGAFRVISADSHIVEPPDMYTSRIEPRFRERAPRIERHKTPVGREYDAWVLDGVRVGTLGALTRLRGLAGDNSDFVRLGRVQAIDFAETGKRSIAEIGCSEDLSHCPGRVYGSRFVP